MAVVALVALVAAACGTTPPQGAASVVAPLTPGAGAVWNTAYTQRLAGRDPVETAVRISETIYASTREEDRSDAVILARVDRPAQAILAVNRLIHFPTNAPLLYIQADRIPPATRAEIQRLRPEGMFADENVQVYLVGEVGPAVLRELAAMNLKVRRFATDDPFRLGEMLDNWSAAVHGDHPDEVVLVPLDSLAWALPFSSWNAHMGQGFFFVARDSVPAATARALQRRYTESYMYLVGNERMVSPAVADRLADFGDVTRIAPPSRTALSAFFAGYRDSGRNFGYWIGDTPFDFGWGIQEDGNNYTIVNSDDVLSAVPSAILSHMGKHGPMLFVGRDSVPGVVAQYLAKVQPDAARPSVQQLNHGWIIGGPELISNGTQAAVDQLLSPPPGLPAAVLAPGDTVTLPAVTATTPAVAALPGRAAESGATPAAGGGAQ